MVKFFGTHTHTHTHIHSRIEKVISISMPPSYVVSVDNKNTQCKSTSRQQ